MNYEASIQVALAAVLLASASAVAQTPQRMDYEQNTIDVFRSASGGVVHINAQATAASAFEEHTLESSTGTGFEIDDTGRILTAFHVIKDKDEITVVLNDRHRFVARLLGTAPRLDLAVLQIDASREDLAPLTLGHSESLLVGQKAIAIGNALGLHNTLTVGVVSGLGRSTDNTATDLENLLIQTDAAINPGDSGGPLLNSAGEVIGINDAIFKGAQNIGFAIPIEIVKSALPDLIEMGHPYKPSLGFGGSEITASLAKLFGLPVSSGFLVEDVLPDSPAAVAGLLAGERLVVVGERSFVLGGDIILAMDGEPITSSSQLTKVLLRSHPGQNLQLQVYRQGKTIDLSVPLQPMQMHF